MNRPRSAEGGCFTALGNGDRIGLILLAGFLGAVYFFVFGESGLLERSRLVREQEKLRQRIETLGEENAGLRGRYEKYKSGELLREEAHRAGYIENGARMVFLRSNDDAAVPDGKNADDSGGSFIEPSHLRILWIVVSMLALLFYFARRTRAEEG